MRREAIVEAGKAEHRAVALLMGSRRVRVAERSSLSPGQVHAREDDGPADELLRPSTSPKKTTPEATPVREIRYW
jgi:hypothetical protein